MMTVQQTRAAAPQSASPQAAPAVPKIEVARLNAWFGKTHALRDVSLNVPSNTVLAIIGPSGCGKSTFVRCLNRMHELVPGARQVTEGDEAAHWAVLRHAP